MNRQLVIKPTILAPATLATMFGVAILISADISLDASAERIGNIMRFALVFFCAWVVTWPVQIWRRSVVTLKHQLAEFSFKDAVCHCCVRGHIGKNGERMECDREILEATICNWFGSVEEFDSAATMQNWHSLKSKGTLHCSQ